MNCPRVTASVACFAVLALAPAARAQATILHCLDQEADVVIAAIGHARDAVRKSETYVNGGGVAEDASLYALTWAPGGATRVLVEQQVLALRRGVESPFAVDCEADVVDVEEIAHVYPTDLGHHIYLGPLFWAEPLYGHRSMAGDIAHEVSHFDDVCRSQDYQNCDAIECAVWNKHYPLLAPWNSYSLQAFVESVPIFLALKEEQRQQEESAPDAGVRNGEYGAWPSACRVGDGGPGAGWAITALYFSVLVFWSRRRVR